MYKKHDKIKDFFLQNVKKALQMLKKLLSNATNLQKAY